MGRIRNLTHVVSEQIGDMTRALWPWSWGSVSGIRNWRMPNFSLRFWDTAHPSTENTQIDYEFTRSLYRNEGEEKLGSFVAKPIVDLQVAFMGIPTVSTDNEALNERLNKCITDFWIDEVQQMFRDAIRDSKIIVRISKPDVLDPLMTLDEAEHCRIECISPERVDIEYSARNKNVIERAIVRHRLAFITEPGSVSQGRDPHVDVHDVIEIMDREQTVWWDQTEDEFIDSLRSVNAFGFVPLLEVNNEWDTSLQGGQSDLETVIPFITALHDIITQGLQAHRYHSTPKLKFKISEINAFVKANFPEAWDDATNQLKENATIRWQGREILFMQADDDAEFIEAKSVLGDTKTLAEFVIDCICISSQTPEWAFMRVDSGSANSDRNAQTVPFVRKIQRKRNGYTRPIQTLLKMAQLMMGLQVPIAVSVSWDSIRPDDKMIEMQAFQQLVMGLEVAAQSGEISDATYRQMIKEFIPHMKSSAQEGTEAQRDMKKRISAQAASQPALPVAGGPQGRNE